MATIISTQPSWFFASLDMGARSFMFPGFDAQVVSASPDDLTVTYSNGSYTQHYYGSYSIQPIDEESALVSGTITGFQQLDFGTSVWYISGLAVSVDVWDAYLEADDYVGLYTYVFSGNDAINGGHAGDVLIGYAGDDRLSTGGGSDTIYGGTGNDILVASGNRADYTIVKAGGKISVTDNRGIDGTATIFGVEEIEFRDQTIAVNTAPTVSVSGVNPTHGTLSVSPASMFSASDADGDLLTYEIWDDTKGNGYFRLNGLAQAELQTISVSAADLASLDFKTSGAGSDTLYVRAFDGLVWSAWKSFTVAAVPNAASVVTIVTPNVTPAHGTTSITASSLFNTSDPDGDTILSYEFWDSGLDPNSGRFVLNGDLQGVDVAIPVNAADLNNLSFRFGTVSDQLWVRAYDGTAWSTWKSVNVAPPPNTAPEVTIPLANVTPGHVLSIAASTLFSGSDLDGDAIRSYEFWDSGLDPKSGRFVLNGTVQGVDVAIPVTAADLNNLNFRLGGVSDQLWVRAFDGLDWSTWKSVNVAAPPNAAPAVDIPILNVTPSHGTTSIAASSLFNATDADNDTLSYEFWDSGLDANSGHFVLSGGTQATNAAIPVTAANLSNLNFQLG